MDLEPDPELESEMSKSGSFACLSRRTISNIFECLIACIIFVAVIYVTLFIGEVAINGAPLERFDQLGLISLVVFISAPLALFGSQKNHYCSLLAYFVLASYHLYGLLMFVYLTLANYSNKSRAAGSSSGSPSAQGLRSSQFNLHQVSVACYTLAIALSLVMCCFKIVSLTNRVEPARVIVADNSASD